MPRNPGQPAARPRPVGHAPGVARTLAFHASRIVIDGGVLLVLGAMSLPFITDPHRSAMALDALPTLLLIAPIFITTLIPDHSRPLPRPVAWASLVLGLTALPYALVKYLDTALLAETLGGHIGIGARVLVFGTFVVIAGIALGLTRVWLGLATGGTTARPSPAGRPGRVTAPQPSSAPSRDIPGADLPAPPSTAGPKPAPTPARPTRAPIEQSPFGDPLFDSLEIPATRVDEPAANPQPGLVFDIEGAADRIADDDREP